MASGAGTSLFAREALLRQGWARNVRVEWLHGVITRIETGVSPRPMDEIAPLLLPGMPNLHSHAFQRAFAGLTERRGPGDDSFWTWRERMYACALAMMPEEVEAIAAQLYIEMLEAGFTRVGEFHYLHHQPDGCPYDDVAEMSGRIAAAAAISGIGLTLLPVFYAHAGFDGAPASAGQRRFINDPARYQRLVEGARQAVSGLSGATIGIAPHSLRAVMREELAEILPLAGAGPVHLHIAEQMREVEECLAVHGRRPVEFLFDSRKIDQRWCLIHATHLTADECSRIARSGAVVGLCPITEANLGDGIFPASAFLAEGGRFGIGSDSNVEIALGGELRMLEYGQRLSHRARNVLTSAGNSTGARLFGEALAGGGRALGHMSGLIEQGPADFITLRARHPGWELPAGDDALDALIFAPGTIEVDCVTVAGRRLVENGRHRDRDAVAQRFGRTMQALKTRI